VSRRALLLAGAAIPLAGCDVLDSSSSPEPTPTPPHPDEIVRERAAHAERGLIALYVAAAAAHPDIGPELEQYADRHLRHIAAIESTAPPQAPGATPTPEPRLDPPAPPLDPLVPPEIPADPDAAVQLLRDAEIAAVQPRQDDCLAARDSRLAAVLASVAACEAAHDRLLRSIQ
jgi:hypothetical protein